jgi:hypothetical protein
MAATDDTADTLRKVIADATTKLKALDSNSNPATKTSSHKFKSGFLWSIVLITILLVILYFTGALHKIMDWGCAPHCQELNNLWGRSRFNGYWQRGRLTFTPNKASIIPNQSGNNNSNLIDKPINLPYCLLIGEDQSLHMIISYQANTVFNLTGDCLLISEPLDDIFKHYQINFRKPVTSYWQIKGTMVATRIWKTAENRLVFSKYTTMTDTATVGFSAINTELNQNQSQHLWTSFDWQLSDNNTLSINTAADWRSRVDESDRIYIKKLLLKFSRSNDVINKINLWDNNTPEVTLSGILVYYLDDNRELWRTRLFIPPAAKWMSQSGACKYLSDPHPDLYGLIVENSQDANHQILVNDCEQNVRATGDITNHPRTQTGRLEIKLVPPANDVNKIWLGQCSTNTATTSNSSTTATTTSSANGIISLDILLRVTSDHRRPHFVPNATMDLGVLIFNPGTETINDSSTRGNPNRLRSKTYLPFQITKTADNDLLILRYSESKDYGPKNDNIFNFIEKTAWVESEPHFMLAGYSRTYYTGSVNRNGNLTMAKIEVIPVNDGSGKIRITPWYWNNNWMEGSFECSNYNNCLLGINDIVVPMYSTQNQAM